MDGWNGGASAFTHLDGEALNVALLMPEEEQAKWEGLSQDGIVISRAAGDWCGKRSLGNGVGECVFLVWTPGTWGELMFAGGHCFSIPTTGVVSGCPEWPISSDTDRWNWNVVYSGKRGMVRAGGSASRIIGDQGTTDPGGGVGGSKRVQPAWQLPVGRGLGSGWASSMQAFPPLGSHLTEARGQDNRKLPGGTKVVLGSRNPIVPISSVGMGRGSSSVVPQVSGARKHGRGMQPAGGNRQSPQRVKDELTDEAEEFSLRTVPKIRIPTGEGSDGSGNCIPSREMHGGVVGRSDAVVSTTTVAGAVALADFARASAPADLAVTDVPAIAGMKVLASAEVHSLAVDDEGAPLVIRTSKQRSDVVDVDPTGGDRKYRGPIDGMSVPEPLEHSVVGVPLAVGDSSVDRVAAPNPIEHSGVSEPADSPSATSVLEPLEHSVVGVPLEVGNSSVDRVTVPNPIEHSGVSEPADLPSASQPMIHSVVSGHGRKGQRDHMCDYSMLRDIRRKDKWPSPEDGEAIVVGAVGSAAPWFLTGWAEEMEIEFMIDTGCQVTILATSVFERLCAADPQVRSRLRLCGRRLVSADSSPLTVKGELELTIVFLGLSCDMLFVVASIGSDGLLGTEALQSCLPHQLDLRTGKLWAEGRLTSQLHQQRLTPNVKGFLKTSVVLPPDSEIVAPISVQSPSDVRLGSCSLVEPSRGLTEEYGVVVGHMLVDASSWSASVLMVNPNAEEIVLPSFTCVGDLIPVSAVSVAMAEPALPNDMCIALPDHLEDIVMGSHPSLGEAGRLLLRELLHRYEHVFPAPGEPVTGRTTSVQHEILTSDARPVRCGPRRLAPAGLRTEQTCVKEMFLGCQIEPSDSPWASPVVLVTKKDGSTRFCVDYRRLNSLTIKDAYPLPRIDDSLRLLGNQQWFSTLDLASGYWQCHQKQKGRQHLLQMRVCSA